VWDYTEVPGTPLMGAKIIAVSVTYHERSTSIPYEVVYYTQIGNPGTAFANAAALD
jgi:hypothetical protein